MESTRRNKGGRREGHGEHLEVGSRARRGRHAACRDVEDQVFENVEMQNKELAKGDSGGAEEVEKIEDGRAERGVVASNTDEPHG